MQNKQFAHIFGTLQIEKKGKLHIKADLTHYELAKQEVNKGALFPGYSLILGYIFAFLMNDLN